MTEAHPETELQWRLRVSRRARYARLRIQPFGGLEVVIPTRFPRHRVAGLVAEHADWARQQLARQARLRAEIRLPSALSLAFDTSAIAVLKFWARASSRRSSSKRYSAEIIWRIWLP